MSESPAGGGPAGGDTEHATDRPRSPTTSSSADERWGVLWDMDGTLVDTEPFWMQAEYELVEAHGGTWTHDHAKRIVGSSLLDGARYIREVASIALEPIGIVEHLLARVAELMADQPPWRPGALELLTALHADRIPCALVTMSWRRFADEVIGLLPPGTFAASVAGDEVTLGKPHPEPYLMAAKQIGVEPERCVAIEDSPTGATSAISAGCTVVGVPHIVDIPASSVRALVPSLTHIDVSTLRQLLPA